MWAIFTIAIIIIALSMWKGFKSEKISFENNKEREKILPTKGEEWTEVDQLRSEMLTMKKDQANSKSNNTVTVVVAVCIGIAVLGIGIFMADMVLYDMAFKF